MAMQKGVFRKRAERQPRTNVAVACDWQGEGERELTLLTAGADEPMLRRVMGYLCANGHGIAEGYTIERQHTPRYRNGYVYDRLAVRLHGYRREYADVGQLLLLFEARLRQEVNGGNVDIYDIDRFLNLSRRDPAAVLTPLQAGDPDGTALRRKSANRRCWERQQELGIAPKGDPEK